VCLSTWRGVQSLIRELSAVPSAEYSNLLVAWDARKLPSSTIIANDEPGTLNRTPAGRRVHLVTLDPGPSRSGTEVTGSQESQGTAQPEGMSMPAVSM
jgi:hypothetical protein